MMKARIAWISTLIQADLMNFMEGYTAGKFLRYMTSSEWKPVRVELDEGWYLVGNKNGIIGLRVRI